MPGKPKIFVRPLSPAEVRELEELYRKTQGADTRTHCHIVLLSHEGKSVPQIAAIVRLGRDAVVRCIRRYEVEGIEGLKPHWGDGRPRKATDEYIQQLLAAVEQDPRDLGLDLSNWTAQNLANYLATGTGIRLSERRVRHYLHQGGWHPRRPVLSLASPDPEYAQKKSTSRG